jgi:hypothetical protein
VGRIVGALRTALGGYELDDSGGDHLRLTTAAVTSTSRAVLLPERLVPLPPRVERAMGRAGIRRLPTHLVRLDVATGDLVIPEPVGWVGSPPGEAVGSGRVGPDARLAPVPGRYRVRGWVVDSDGAAPTRAHVLAQALWKVVNRGEVGTQVALLTLADVLADATVTPMGRLQGADTALIATLQELLSGT